MHSTPRFIQGVFAFEGKGLGQRCAFDGLAGYVVIDLGLVEV